MAWHGPQSLKGKQGVPGSPGEDGEPGLTIPGQPGARGPAGTPGNPGMPGEDGEDGQRGAPGPTGPAGPASSPIPGSQGEDGEDGPMGPPGPQGLTGATGATGPSGSGGGATIFMQAEDGEDGMIVANNALTIFQMLDLVKGLAAFGILFHNGSSWGALQGTSRQVCVTRATGTAYAEFASTGEVLLQDQKAAGTDGGSSTSGSWQLRTLNTEVYDTNGDCSLAASQFTLAAGEYEIEASAPAYNSSLHQIRLNNTTDGTFVYGTSEFNIVNAQTRSFVKTRVQISGAKVYQIEHRVNNSQLTNGYGVNNNFGGTEVYTEVRVRRLPVAG